MVDHPESDAKTCIVRADTAGIGLVFPKMILTINKANVLSVLFYRPVFVTVITDIDDRGVF
jgi:hypothetical protein